MKHSIKIAFIVSVISSYFLWDRGAFVKPHMDAPDVRVLLGLYAQVSATMLGFLLAAMAILASISGHRLIRNMQRTGHFVVLLNRFFTNTIAFGISMISALGSSILNANLQNGAVLASGLFVFACLLLCDVGWRFWLVLTEIGASNN